MHEVLRAQQFAKVRKTPHCTNLSASTSNAEITSSALYLYFASDIMDG
jgi:hypothetical protein